MGKAEEVRLVARLDDGHYIVEHADGRLERRRDQTDWNRLRSMSDDDIESAADSDDSSSMPANWADFAVRKPSSRRTTIMLDDDMIRFFSAGGRGYQTRIKAVLREYMNAHRKA